MLNVAVPGLCQMPTFRQEADPVTQIVCKAIASPAAAQPSIVTDTQEKQQQQLDAEQDVQDIANLVSEIIANGTEQVCSGDWVRTHVRACHYSLTFVLVVSWEDATVFSKDTTLDSFTLMLVCCLQA